MTSKEKENINENKSTEIKPTDMSQDELCLKKFLYDAFIELTARQRNKTKVGVDRKAFASDVYKFLIMPPQEMSLYELGVNEKDMKIRGERVIKKIFAKYNL